MFTNALLLFIFNALITFNGLYFTFVPDDELSSVGVDNEDVAVVESDIDVDDEVVVEDSDLYKLKEKKKIYIHIISFSPIITC